MSVFSKDEDREVIAVMISKDAGDQLRQISQKMKIPKATLVRLWILEKIKIEKEQEL